jgi:short-subunit dehydrogenase involved in D-alanine esterification of teichoic acids
VGGTGVKVIEIVPPAVRTELHDYDGKEEKGSGGGGKGVGMDLEAFTEEVWKSLEEGKDDTAVGMAAKEYEVFEEKRQGMFRMLMELMKGSGEK